MRDTHLANLTFGFGYWHVKKLFMMVSNDPRGIFQHSNLDMKQKGIKWSCIQIEPVLGQKTIHYYEGASEIDSNAPYQNL